MKTTERELARLLQQERAQDRAGCPSADELASAALRALPPARQQAVLDHLGGCADCAEELRESLALREWAGVVPPAGRERVLLALAASFAAATLGLGIWNVSLREANRRLSASAGAPEQPAVNVPIVDLEPADTSRGTSAAPQRLSIPREVSRVVLVLATGSTQSHAAYALEIADAEGRPLWRGPGLVRGRLGTFTASVPRALLAGGPRRVRLFGIDAGRETTLESHSLELDPR